jgi:hypothetical protein
MSSLVEVTGAVINAVEDISKKIILSVWTATAADLSSHDFQVDVGNDWVCIGGGATAQAKQELHNKLAAILTQKKK